MRRKEASAICALLSKEPFNKDSAMFITELLTQGQDKWIFGVDKPLPFELDEYIVTLRKVR